MGYQVSSKGVARLAAACLLLAAAGAAFAAEPDPGSPSFWDDIDVTLGAGGAVGPEFEGADSYDPGFVPYVQVSWRDIVEIGTGGLVVAYPVTERVRLGPVVSYDSGRDESDSDDLRGLGDVDPSATVGGMVQVDLGPVTAGAAFSRALSSHQGWLAELSLGREFALSKRLGLTLAAETSLADGDYMAAYFGVSPRQAARSGLKRFEPEAGFKSVGLSAQLRYALDDSWSLFAASSYARLVGDAADSPLVEERGSANQVSALAGLAYRF